MPTDRVLIHVPELLTEWVTARLHRESLQRPAIRWIVATRGFVHTHANRPCKVLQVS